jgi:hypothetical protein
MTDSILNAATFGAVLAVVVAMLRIIEALVRKRNGGDDRGRIVETIRSEGKSSRALMHDSVNELRGLREDMQRHGSELHEVRQSLSRLEQNQAVMLDRQRGNGAA